MAERSDADGAYAVAGWRTEGGDWHDVEAGAPLPKDSQWEHIDLVTLNMTPGEEDGFYRTANVFMGFDAPPSYNWYDTEGEDYTLDDLAGEYADVYGFGAQ
jgi:hypothetical protein